ncbi:hypothetical protein K160097B7_34310 [[Clostridium] hylemonae]
MKKRDKKRLLALALCLCLVAFGRPVPALASAGTDVSVAPDSAVTSTTPAASASGSGGESGKTPESAQSTPGITITGFAALAPEVAKQSYEAGELASQDDLALPGALEATGADGVPLPVTVSGWASNTPFDPDVAGVYTFAPTLDLSALPAGSGLDPDVEPPTIKVTLTGAANALALAPRAGTVTVNSWDELQDALNARKADIEIKWVFFEAMGSLLVDYPVTIHSDNGGGIHRRSYTGVMFDVRDGGALTLQNVQLDGRNVANADRLVTVASGGSLTLDDGTSLDNSTSGGAYVAGGTLTMRNGSSISDNTADEGAGVYLTGSTATFHMEGGYITANRTTGTLSDGHGGGVYVAGGAKMTMSGNARIGGAGRGNKTAVNGDGGGVYLTGAGSRLDMTGGGILGNEAPYGGGIAIEGGAQMTMSGTAQIGGSGAANRSNSGGSGVYVMESAFIMDGGSITGNAGAHYGGGVFVGTGATFDMAGGDISGNMANNGGGVSVVTNGAFTMTGGSITGNTANNGGGVSVSSGATMNMSGTAQIGGSAAGEANTASDDGGGVYLDGTFNMTGGGILGNEAVEGGGVFMAGRDSKLDMQGGGILGNTATLNGGGVFVDRGATFTLSGTAQIGGSGIDEGNEAPKGGGVCVWDRDSKLDMQGGSILGNGAGDNGGGVYLDGGATMSMSGTAQIGGSGSNEGNEAQNGGGVHISDGIFNMDSGSITGNTAGNNGWAVYVESTFTQNVEIQGGLVAAQGGDTVHVDSTGLAFTVSGGAVMQTDPNGNAIYSVGSDADKVQITAKGTVYSRGKAVVYEDAGLTFPGPTGDGLIILQTGDNAPYKAGTNTDLSPTPGTAAVQWALESGTGGIRYKNNTNTGFLPLGATVEPVDGVPHTINMTINDSTIPQTGDGADPLPWLLAMPAALAGGVSLLFYRKRRYTKQHG